MITLKAGIYQKMILATILILGAVACFGRNTFKIDVNGNEYIVGATNINDTFELVENNEHVKLTPLIYASAYGNYKLAKFSIEKGADIEAKDNKGWTALIWASNKGNLEMVKLLIEKGADIEAKDNDGFTALMWASFNGHLEVVKYLLENGADVNIKDKKGYTVLNYKITKDVREVLMKTKAK